MVIIRKMHKKYSFWSMTQNMKLSLWKVALKFHFKGILKIETCFINVFGVYNKNMKSVSGYQTRKPRKIQNFFNGLLGLFGAGQRTCIPDSTGQE